MNRTERKIQWLAIRKELADLGYHSPAIYLDRFMMYRLIVVAVNHLADALQRDPHRVYQALLCRAERSRLGNPYCSWKQAKPPAGAPLERERRRIAVVCPVCLHDLLEAGPVSEPEVRAQFQANQAVFRGELSQDLPQSSVSEAVRSRYERDGHTGQTSPPPDPGSGSGAGGQGGPDPRGPADTSLSPTGRN